MARSLLKNCRVYIGGYDLSGYARSFGPVGVSYEEATDDAINATVKGTWAGQATLNFGTLNALFDNTATTGIHTLLGTAGTSRNVMAVAGMETDPAIGCPVFCGQFYQMDYVATPSDSPVTLTIPFAASGIATSLLYSQPWGVLEHINEAETAVNTSDYVDGLAASSLGGWMMYQVTTSAGAGDITATIKVQDSTTTTSGDFGDLLSSGVINTGSSGVAVPTSGVVALGTTAAVKRYTRWQIVLGTATSVTFTLAFMRNYHN